MIFASDLLLFPVTCGDIFMGWNRLEATAVSLLLYLILWFLSIPPIPHETDPLTAICFASVPPIYFSSFCQRLWVACLLWLKHCPGSFLLPHLSDLWASIATSRETSLTFLTTASRFVSYSSLYGTGFGWNFTYGLIWLIPPPNSAVNSVKAGASTYFCLIFVE